MHVDTHAHTHTQRHMYCGQSCVYEMMHILNVTCTQVGPSLPEIEAGPTAEMGTEGATAMAKCGSYMQLHLDKIWTRCDKNM